jgi:hypothetical protein
MSPPTKEELEVQLMETQLKLYRKQERYELVKVVAAFLVGIAAFVGGVLAVSAWWHPSPQTINATIHFEGPAQHD